MKSRVVEICLDRVVEICLDISLSATQKQRFQKERDTPKKVTRMCIAINTIKYKDDYTISAYLSPAFFRRLPEVLFHRQKPLGFGREGAFLLSLGEFEKALDSNMNNILFYLRSGNIGFPHSRFKHIDQKEVFDWFYEKLKQTLENPLEEEEKRYVLYMAQTPIFKIIEDKADELILMIR